MDKKDSKQSVPSSHGSPDAKDIEATFENFRGQIDVIDAQIVSLLARRHKLVEQLVEVKKAHHLPIYHPAREEDLISNRRHQAQAEGLDPDYLEELFRMILRRSRLDQAVNMAQKAIRPEARVLLVGGKRGLGHYFHRWFNGAGYRVRILGRNDWPEVEHLCNGIDLVMICVPVEVTLEVIKKIGPHLPGDCILADITSIKAIPVQAMLNAHSGPVIGLHPLFGPGPLTMDKQIIAATPARDLSACQWLLDQLSVWGGIVVKASPEEHDDIMGFVQTLRHFAAFAFGRFLCSRRVDLHRTLEFSSPIYRLEIGMVGRLFSQDPHLYAEIIFASPERRTLLKEYLASLSETLPMIEAGDKEGFCSEFKKIAEWFGPFSDQAMRESTYLIEKLIERF